MLLRRLSRYFFYDCFFRRGNGFDRSCGGLIVTSFMIASLGGETDFGGVAAARPLPHLYLLLSQGISPSADGDHSVEGYCFVSSDKK